MAEWHQRECDGNMQIISSLLEIIERRIVKWFATLSNGNPLAGATLFPIESHFPLNSNTWCFTTYFTFELCFIYFPSGARAELEIQRASWKFVNFSEPKPEPHLNVVETPDVVFFFRDAIT